MRKKLEDLLIEKAEKDSSIYLLVNDLGSFENFRNKFPSRFINCGIGEPNLVSVAAGLVLDGNKPIIYSVAGFCIHRGFEQLKFEVCHHSKNITIINAAAGLCYNRVGAGHYLIDDLSLMQTLPDVEIYAPIDIPEFEKFFNEALYSPQLSYIRTGLDGCPDIAQDGEGYLQKTGSKFTVVSTGIFSAVALAVCSDLPVNVLHIGKLSETILPDNVILLEDHIKFGGLSNLIKGKIIDHIHLPSVVSEMAETRNELLIKYGFDNESIRRRILGQII